MIAAATATHWHLLLPPYMPHTRLLLPLIGLTPTCVLSCCAAATACRGRGDCSSLPSRPAGLPARARGQRGRGPEVRAAERPGAWSAGRGSCTCGQGEGAEIGGVGVDPGDEKKNGGAGRANVDMCGEAGVGVGAPGNAGCTDGASAHKKGGKKGGAGGKRRAN